MIITATFSTGKTVEFNPSFRNIKKIGTPKEIVDVYSVISAYLAGGGVTSLFKKRAHAAACNVLNSTTDEYIGGIIGGYQMTDRGVKNMVGFESKDNVIRFAEKILIEGMIGHPKTKKAERSKESVDEFNVDEYVNIASSKNRGLGLSKEEALDLSMTEFVQRMEWDYPPDEKEEWAASMTEEEYSAKKDAFAAIRAKAGVK